MATKYKTVDAYVKGEVKPEHRPIVASIRAAIREAAPKAAEMISYGIPLWRGNSHIAFIGSVKNDIKLGFVRGLKFEDKYKLLKGRGKVTRHLVFKTPGDVKKTMLRYYIRQAVKLDTKPAKASRGR